ncbi:hypothetical protein [Streptomyces melanogenes]|uniref:Uncharacterized protein n=1 Tax=Streptomyces melanogenes TaxID=67326 RepID=A0ABZ1XZ32_9ACTN|nr:hypothetical protein [Streptomyces melanogenes]
MPSVPIQDSHRSRSVKKENTVAGLAAMCRSTATVFLLVASPMRRPFLVPVTPGREKRLLPSGAA